MMFCNGYNIFGACFFEKCYPCYRIKFFCLEHRNKIFVPEFALWPVCFHMMFEFVTALLVHFPWVPFAAKCRNRINAPMNEDSEFRIPEPIRNLVFFQRFPISLVPVLGMNE